MRMGVEEQLERIRHGAVELVGEDGLRVRLAEAVAGGRPLRVKLGLDPTAPDLHLGHAVVLRRIRQIQDMGHTAVLIIGDFTGRIGDPTGRSKTRRQLTEEDVLRNAGTYERQLFRILDPDRTEIAFNGRWLSRMALEEVVRLAAGCTVARMMEREDFAGRFAANAPIGLHELLYPLLQGQDSVAVRADLELGGTDQRFNILMGRDVQRAAGQPPQAALFLPLLEGTDGVEKMSKSLGNSIGIDEAPESMFGKVMSIPDACIVRYFELATDATSETVADVRDLLADGRTNPRDVKARLAREIVRLYHGETSAASAAREFDAVFRDGGVPEVVPEAVPRADEVDAAGRLDLAAFLHRIGLAGSRSEARRLVAQGGVRCGGTAVEDPRLPISGGEVLRVGKRGFVRIGKEYDTVERQG